MTGRVEAVIHVKLDRVPKGFSLVERVIGEKDENISYIKKETGADTKVKITGQYKNEITMSINHDHIEGMKKAEALIQSLVSTVKEDYEDFLATQPPFIKSRYKVDDMKTTQTYHCRPKCNMDFDKIQTYVHHLSSEWHLVNSRRPEGISAKGPAPGQGEKKEFIGTVTDVKGQVIVVSDSILYDLRNHAERLTLEIGDRVKGVQVPSTNPNYRWKALSITVVSQLKDRKREIATNSVPKKESPSIQQPRPQQPAEPFSQRMRSPPHQSPVQPQSKPAVTPSVYNAPRAPPSKNNSQPSQQSRPLLADPPVQRQPPAILEYGNSSETSKRSEYFETQMLNAFSFFLNEQTTPKSLWNTHHTVQTQAKSRRLQRPLQSQSPSYCMLCNIKVMPALMQNHLLSPQHRVKYVEKQLEFGLERFPQVYGPVPLPGVQTNAGKRLAVDAVNRFFGTDLPSHNSDAFKSMVLLNGAVKGLYCEVCNQSMPRFDAWISHVMCRAHATKCVEVMADKGLHFYLQRFTCTPAPAPQKMKEAIRNIAKELETTGRHRPEYAIETETVPDLDTVPPQPEKQVVKPGLLGDAPIGLAPAGFEGGPDNDMGFVGGGDDLFDNGVHTKSKPLLETPSSFDNFGNKRSQAPSLLGPPPKTSRMEGPPFKPGLLGNAPQRFEDSGDWEGGGFQAEDEWVGPQQDNDGWDGPPEFRDAFKDNHRDHGWQHEQRSLNRRMEREGYQGGFGGPGGRPVRMQGPPSDRPSLLGAPPPRPGNDFDRGEFVGGGGDDFIGGGDVNFLANRRKPLFNTPPALNPNVAGILEAAQGLMATMHQGSNPVHGFMGTLRAAPGMSNPELIAVQALGSNIRSLIDAVQAPQAIEEQILSRLTYEDRNFLLEVQKLTGIDNMPLLVRLVQTVRSLDPHILETLNNIPSHVLLNMLGGNSPQQKLIVQQVMSLLGSGAMTMPRDIAQPRNTGKPGLLGDHPLAFIQQAIGNAGGVPSLLDMPAQGSGLHGRRGRRDSDRNGDRRH